jgi:MFS family permease
MATNDYPERTEEIVSWVEATTGIGLIVGPILGSALYSMFGFSKTFEYYGSFLILLGILVEFNFPDSTLTGVNSEINESLLSESMDDQRVAFGSDEDLDSEIFGPT